MRTLVKKLGALLLGLSVATVTFTGFNSVQVQAAENDDVEIITEGLAGYEGFEETEISEDEFQRIMEENGVEALEAEANGAETVEAGEYTVTSFRKASHATARNAAYAVYTTDALYNTMTYEQRQFYDRLYAACETYLTSTANLYSDSYRPGQYFVAPVSIGALGRQEANDIILCFSMSNPQFYFLANSYITTTTTSGTYFMLECFNHFADGNVRAGYTSRVFGSANQIISAANAKASVYDKLRTAEVMLANRVEYGATPNEYKYWDQSCVGALLLNRGVCASYAEAYELICNAMGITTIAVTSVIHEWNQVYINGNWYVVDATWDDYGKTSVGSSYFLKSYSTVMGYSASAREMHTIESEVWRTVRVPSCNADYNQAAQSTASYVAPAAAPTPAPTQVKTNDGSIPMYRLYNPNSGEHFYTANYGETSFLCQCGWNYEGIAWYAPQTGTPVYRLYNANAGDHHYTMNLAEVEMLKKAGWKYEGEAWKSGGNVKMYRGYNPNAKAGSHHYTSNKAEIDMIVKAGWKYEGEAWMAVR